MYQMPEIRYQISDIGNQISEIRYEKSYTSYQKSVVRNPVYVRQGPQCYPYLGTGHKRLAAADWGVRGVGCRAFCGPPVPDARNSPVPDVKRPGGLTPLAD